MGFLETLKKFKSGLSKTRESIVTQVQKLTAGKSKIDDELLEQLEQILLEADIGVATTSIILERLKNRVKEEHYDDPMSLLGLLKNEMAQILSGKHHSGTVSTLPVESRPCVIMVVGVNGVGKTTTIGKLAYQYREAGYHVVIGAADTFRAAANEQLEVWANRAGVEIVQQTQGSDPAAVAFDALSSAIAQKADVVIIDTAGRLHTKTHLMEELKKIKRVIEKRLPGAPHEVLLVLDATTGQNGLQQVKYFSAAVDVTGLVLTKLDGTAKGGIVLAISHEISTPVKFIGVGERIDDLQIFDHLAFVDALFVGNTIE